MSVEIFTDKKEQHIAVESFWLQQYRNALIRLTVTQISGRILFIGLILLLLFIHPLSNGVGVFLSLVSVALHWVWVSEHRTNRATLNILEKTIAQITGGVWEDIYIRLRYESTGSPLFFRSILRYEPFLWLTIFLMTLLDRILIPSLF